MTHLTGSIYFVEVISCQLVIHDIKIKGKKQ